MMYYLQHLTPQPSRYDGKAQLRHGLQPQTLKVDQTRLYQTPPDEIDKRLAGKRRELARRPSRERAELMLMLAGGPKNRQR